MTSPSIVLLRTQSDARLLALAREGHERAFEAIVERYRKQLLRACRRVLPEARAEDALQHALLAAWTAIGRGDEIRELRPWLHRTAHNTALNQLRVAGYDFEELQDSLRIADGADDELERRAVMRQTLAGLAALPERQRAALLAIAVEGRSQDEVASDLGLSSGAVRQLVHRARSAMRTAATAITPLPLVSWVAAAATRSEPMTARIAELSAGAGGAGAGAVIAKAGAVAVIAGGVVTGPAVIERRAEHRDVRQVQREPHVAKPAQAAPRRDEAVVAKPVSAVVVHPQRAATRQHALPRHGGRTEPRRPQAPRRKTASRLDSGDDGGSSGEDRGSRDDSGDRRDHGDVDEQPIDDNSRSSTGLDYSSGSDHQDETTTPAEESPGGGNRDQFDGEGSGGNAPAMDDDGSSGSGGGELDGGGGESYGEGSSGPGS